MRQVLLHETMHVLGFTREKLAQFPCLSAPSFNRETATRASPRACSDVGSTEPVVAVNGTGGRTLRRLAQDRANGGSNASRTGLSILRGVQIVGTSGRAPAETSVLLRATRCESAPCHRRDIPVHDLDQGRRTEDEDRRHPRFARWPRIDSSFLTGWLPSSKFFIVDQHALRL